MAQSIKEVEFLPAGEVAGPYPVEVQNKVKGDQTEKYSAAGLVENAEDLKREMVAKQYRCRLVDETQKQNRI